MSDIIYGRNTVDAALDNKRVRKVYILDKHDLLKKVIENKIEYEIVDRNKLDRLSKRENHQGIIAEVKSFEYASLKDIMKKENGFIVMLDNLNDVHNLGAIIRTCECAGVDGLIYKKNNNVRVNETVAKVASGALEYLKIVEVTNLSNTIQVLKDNGYWIYGSAGDSNDSYDNFDYKENVVLVIGSEGEGISRLVKKNCDYIISLPLKGKINSLNASVAAGIVIYEVVKQNKIALTK